MKKQLVRMLVLGFGLQLGAQSVPDQMPPDMSSCPEHAKHMAAKSEKDHPAAVDARHDSIAPSHEVTRHSFRLFSDGGAIELRANSAADAATIAAVRSHLSMIEEQFSANQFSTPEFVHGRPPDGVADMSRLAKSIEYRYEELPDGGRIGIRTKNREAVDAVHRFMRFQIAEHRTRDSGKIETKR